MPSLPPGTPGGWVTREPRMDDAPAIRELVAACDIAVLGYPDIALADVQVELSRDADLQTLVLDEGRVLAWASLHDKAAGRTIADVYVHPALELGVGDRLSAWCWEQQIARAARVAARRGAATTELDVGVLGGDQVTGNRLRAMGFAPHRTFWRMRRELTRADATPTIAERVSVRGVTEDDVHTAYDILESAFADHWNHHPRTFEEWQAQVVGNAGFDRSLWWLADLNGQAVGALLATRQMAGEDAIYIASLGTLRAARGCGVGTSLLRQAFAAGLREGWSLAKLNVDADSTTSAPAVYAGVGLTVEFSAEAWLLEVAAG